MNPSGCACGKHRTAAGCAGARVLNALSNTRRQEIAREGGTCNALIDRNDVIARYVHLDRDDAIWQAWKDARRIKRWQRYRARGSSTT